MRVAIAGTGAMARVHAHAFAALPDVDVVAVLGRDARRTHEFAETLHAAPFTDIVALLARAPVDVIDCCTATPGHRAVVEAAAERFVDILAAADAVLAAAGSRA